MRYLGLDISASETGIAILDRDSKGFLSLVFVGHIKTESKVKGVPQEDGQRLKLIRDCLYEVLERFNPDVIIKESQGADMSKFRSVSLVSKATGVCEETCQSWWGKEPLKIHAYPPSTIKKEVTGFGGVDKTIKGNTKWDKYLRKKPVIDEVIKLFGDTGFSFTIYKGKTLYDDNECDAVASILTHFKKEGMIFYV